MSYLPEQWLDADGKAISCHEKIKVLTENMREIETYCQEALEDAVLMGCDEKQVRKVLQLMVQLLQNPFSSR